MPEDFGQLPDNIETSSKNKNPATAKTVAGQLFSVVAGEGIEPPTRGFSIPCSTN